MSPNEEDKQKIKIEKIRKKVRELKSDIEIEQRRISKK
jgi:hypothetical protein